MHNASQTTNTFVNLLKEMEAFVDTSELKVAFDRDGVAYLIGADFCEKLEADPAIWRLVKQEMTAIIAKRVPRIALSEYNADSK